MLNRSFDLRDWQQEAYRAVIEKFQAGSKDFLCVATPGAGKTKFALVVAHHFLTENLCKRIVVVTPTEGLKKQWAYEAANFAGIDIDPDFVNSQTTEALDYKGIAITYALLGQDKKDIHRKNTSAKSTLVILDEIHHAGDNLSWGNAIRNAFDGAVFRLAISGTAFRSDDNPIPFITYNEQQISVPDYSYSYERAIKENVCRPVFFCSYDGKMKWKVDQQEFEHAFGDHLTPDQESRRLRTALDPKGKWVRDVITEADKKLNEIRLSGHINAAGLIFASTQKDAKEIAKVVESITGSRPPVVISDDPNASFILDDFKQSNEKWIVSVKMVSEGVDIPRLRVGVYLTIIKAELFFRQAVGRFVRVLKELDAQDAFIFIPQDKDMIKLAENIQVEREHALLEAERTSKSSGSNSGLGFDLFGNSTYTPALKGRFIPLESQATSQKNISVAVEIKSGATHTIDRRKPFSENPVYMQKEILRSKINELAKKIALKRRNGNSNIKPDWKWAHKQWLAIGGKEMHLETIEELKRRLNYFEKLLRA